MSTPAPEKRANPNLPDEARRPDVPSEGTRKDTGRNDNSTRQLVLDNKSDVFMYGQEIRPVDPDQPDIDPRMPPRNLAPLSRPDIEKFRVILMQEVTRSREFIDTYTRILARPELAKGDYRQRVKNAVTNHTENVWDYFNEDERLFDNRSLTGPTP